MNDIENGIILKIITKHQEIGNYLNKTLDTAIEIGGLLSEQKDRMKHGEFLPWIKSNLPFSERAARDYMRFYRDREKLKSANVADLTQARALLTGRQGFWDLVKDAVPILDEMEKSAITLEELNYVINSAKELQNMVSERRIREERMAGELINEIQGNNGKAKQSPDKK